MSQPQRESWKATEADLFRLLVENVRDYAIFIVDPQGRVQTWNRGAERLLGYRDDEIIGQSADIFFTPEDLQAGGPQREMEQALEVGRGDDDRWHVRKDGSRFWSGGVMTPLWDDARNLRGFAKIMRDRTEFKRAEDARDDALEYAESIIETVREPMLVLDGQLQVRTANRSFYRAFRVTREDTEGRLVYDLGNGQWNVPKLRSLLEDILPQNTVFNDFEVTHEFPSIGRRVMLVNARRVYRQVNHAELVLLALEDITERRRLEDERRELETRYTSLVKNIRDHSIFTLDTGGRITSWNREAERILGHAEAEALGQHFSMIFTPEDRSAGVPGQELATALSEGRAEDERWHLRKNGERFWALGIVTPTQDATGRHTGYSKILRDMTDRKRAEEALQRADKRKDEFLATLAHELRNPLAPIRNGLQLLKLTADPAAREQVRAMMERQFGQMVRLVDDLLDVSRITRNRLELRKAPVELWAVVQSAVETARPQVEARDHRLTVTLPPQPVYLDGDLTRLAQVFWNLLNNSAKYTEPGGRISLTAEVEGGEAVVTVRDNGIGIPAESLPNLFE
ncbi:MAG TPA: PAS domain S-box protein, partial [Fimbriiglobus sp.]|nr:PAS domain S-box protein [Fimbriiglobus sp.]